jgi:hypothetical protein
MVDNHEGKIMDRNIIFKLCKLKFSSDPSYVCFQENSQRASQVHGLIAQNRNMLAVEELDLVRTFFLSAVSFANKPDVIGEIVSNNSDYSIYKALKQSIEEGDMAILSRSLTGVSDKSAFAVFAFLYPNKYSVLPGSVVRLAMIIFQNDDAYNDVLNVNFESMQQKILLEISVTNLLLCQNFEKFGFESPLEFSIILGILYRNVYHQKLEQNDAAGKGKDEKFEMRYFSYIKTLSN